MREQCFRNMDMIENKSYFDYTRFSYILPWMWPNVFDINTSLFLFSNSKLFLQTKVYQFLNKMEKCGDGLWGLISVESSKPTSPMYFLHNAAAFSFKVIFHSNQLQVFSDFKFGVMNKFMSHPTTCIDPAVCLNRKWTPPQKIQVLIKIMQIQIISDGTCLSLGLRHLVGFTHLVAWAIDSFRQTTSEVWKYLTNGVRDCH